MLTHDDIVGDIYAERIVDALDIHSDNVYSEVDRMVAEYENTIRADERRKFAEWLVEHVGLDCTDCVRCFRCKTGTCADNLLDEYEKEQMKEGGKDG